MEKELPVIGEVDFNELKPLDTIYVMFGFVYVRLIIKRITPKGIIFTLPQWLKKENVFISYNDIMWKNDKMPVIKGKSYSKLRWWLKT